MLITFKEISSVLLKNNITVRGAFHVGAHDCEEMSFYSRLCLGTNDIVWVEALPWKVEEARNRGIENVYNAVITDRDDEEIVFNVANNGQSSSVLEFGTHSSEHPDVFYNSWVKCKSIRIDTFLKRNGISSKDLNFWNFDIQGCELMALKGAVENLVHVDVLYLEVNEKELYKGCGLTNELDDMLRPYGFERVTTVMTVHGWGDALYVKIPSTVENDLSLCYYSCYFGPSESNSNVIGDVPSKRYDCYYFTNNQCTYDSLENTEWKRVFVPVTVKNDSNLDTLDSKLLKSCPHLVKELQGYDYSVYIDTRNILLSEESVLRCITKSTKPIIMIPHRWWPQAHAAVVVEYYKSFEQERYVRDKERMERYLNDKLNEGYLLTLPMHYETGFIVRNQKDVSVKKFNETWYDEILKCGIQCQISFFFVQQLCPNMVQSLCEPLDPLIVVDKNTFDQKYIVHKHRMDGGFIGWHLIEKS